MDQRLAQLEEDLDEVKQIKIPNVQRKLGRLLKELMKANQRIRQMDEKCETVGELHEQKIRVEPHQSE